MTLREDLPDAELKPNVTAWTLGSTSTTPHPSPLSVPQLSYFPVIPPFPSSMPRDSRNKQSSQTNSVGDALIQSQQPWPHFISQWDTPLPVIDNSISLHIPISPPPRRGDDLRAELSRRQTTQTEVPKITLRVSINRFCGREEPPPGSKPWLLRR